MRFIVYLRVMLAVVLAGPGAVLASRAHDLQAQNPAVHFTRGLVTDTGSRDISRKVVAVPTPLPTGTRPSQSLIFLGRVRIPARPLPTPDGQHRQAQVPILMYHYIDPVPADADAIRRDLTIPPEIFAAHLDRIQALGFETISLQTLLRHLATGSDLPAKPIILTFDDGYDNHYSHVFPLLQERDMTGTFFIVATFPTSGNTSYMTWDRIREMAAAGMEIESHAQFHDSLAGRSDAYLREQAMASALVFEQELGHTPRIISYPLGHYDPNTIRVYREQGYRAGITVRNGLVHDTNRLFHLHRIRIHGYHDADDVAWLLSEEGAAWLRRQQQSTQQRSSYP